MFSESPFYAAVAGLRRGGGEQVQPIARHQLGIGIRPRYRVGAHRLAIAGDGGSMQAIEVLFGECSFAAEETTGGSAGTRSEAATLRSRFGRAIGLS